MPTEGIDFEWVNTPGYSWYQVAGKPLHAVFKHISKSACGIRRSVWSPDFFNVDKCKRCEKALKKMVQPK